MKPLLAVPALGAVLVLAACGGAAKPQPPSARALAAKMGCQVLAQGQGFAGYDTRGDIRLQGPAPGCLGGEIWTFPDAKAQKDWLHQAAGASRSLTSGITPTMVVGSLWAVSTGDPSAQRSVIKALGGREVSFS